MGIRVISGQKCRPLCFGIFLNRFQMWGAESRPSNYRDDSPLSCQPVLQYCDEVNLQGAGELVKGTEFGH